MLCQHIKMDANEQFVFLKSKLNALEGLHKS